jgi:hypothetical protein
MASEEQEFPIGGMFEAVVEENGHGHSLVNLVHDPEGFWRETPGTLPVTNAAPGSGSVMSCTWFNPRPNLRWLVYEIATTAVRSLVQYVDFQTLAPVSICTRRRISSADKGTLFLENAGRLYLFSTVDAPLAWNGLWTSPVGFTGPAAAPLVAAGDQGFSRVDRAGGDMSGPTLKDRTTQRGVGDYPDGSNSSWRYGYAQTFINEIGQESPLSSVQFASGFNGTANDVGKRMVRVKSPRGPDHVRGMRLYRTRNLINITDPGAQATMYLLEEFATGAGFDYCDQTSDPELGLPFDRDSVGPVPIAPAAAAFWAGSMWLGGAPVDPTRLHYSAPLFPEQFPSINYLEVGSSRTGHIVALKVTQRGLVVFKEGGVYFVRGSHAQGFQVETVSESVGCAAPRAIEYVRDLGLMFLSRTGPHVLVGSLTDDQPTKVVPIQGIRRTWRRFAGSLSQAVSVYQPELDEVWFHVPQGGTLTPTLGLVYHADIGQWSLRTGPISCFTRHQAKTWVGSWDDTNAPGMHLLSYGASTFLGSTLTHSWSGLFTFSEARTLQVVDVWGVATGTSAPLSLTTTPDQRSPIPQTEVGKKQQANTAARDVWDTGKWNRGDWSDHGVARLRMGVTMTTGREIGLAFAATRMRLFALNLVMAGLPSPRPEQP